ncbi:MAG: CPBP family intramembrane glutamic endopeptidase [Parvibaculum sp.]
MAVWGPDALRDAAAPAGRDAIPDAPRGPPQRWYDILLVPLLAFVATAVVAVLAVIAWTIHLELQARGSGDPRDWLQSLASDPFFVHASGVAFYLLAMAALTLPLAMRGYSLGTAHFPRFGQRAVLLAFVAGVALAFAVVPLLEYLPAETVREIETREQLLMPRNIPEVLLFTLSVALLAPLAEEIYFRGILLPVLARHLRFGAAAVIVAALFSLMHGHIFMLVGIGGWALSGVIFVIGVAFAYAARWSGALYAPVAMHAAYNATLIVPGIIAILVGSQT